MTKEVEPVRTVFREELAFITDQLVEMSRLSAQALERATQALLEADLRLAEQVISDDGVIDAIRRDLDNRAIGAMALQQPVAKDLRQLVTALRMSSDLERAGDLARHVAKLARLRYPERALTERLQPTFVEMAQIGQEMILRAGDVVQAQDPTGAVALQRRDDDLDRLHREVFRLILDPESSTPTQVTVDATLLSRYYERFADHAVSVAIRVIYLVTGSWHDGPGPGEFEASRLPTAPPRAVH